VGSFTLTSTFDDDHFEYKGDTYHVDMMFDNILLLFEMFDDESLLDISKIDLALEMLIDEYEAIEFETIDDMVELFQYVMKTFLEIDLSEQEQDNKNDQKDMQQEVETKKKFMDYSKDADIIYASFISAYNIDLFEQHGKMHWKKFRALVSHLDDNSKLKQVIGYRTMKIPTGKHADPDQVKHIKKMKQIYALENDQSDEEMAQSLNSFANALKQRSINKNGGTER
jgi:hypothetical protein